MLVAILFLSFHHNFVTSFVVLACKVSCLCMLFDKKERLGWDDLALDAIQSLL